MKKKFAVGDKKVTSLSNQPKVAASDALQKPEWVLDAMTMAKMALNKKYKMTYDAHRSMVNTHKNRNVELHVGLRDFRSFLIEVGPKTVPTDSLDRIDGTKGYVPGNLRWASKKVQSRNRANVVTLTHEGKTLALTEWAEKTNQQPSALRARKKLGWTDSEIVTGIKSHEVAVSGGIWAWTPWPADRRVEWERHFQRHHWAGEHRLRFYLRIIDEELQKHGDLMPGVPDDPASEHWLERGDTLAAVWRDAQEKIQTTRGTKGPLWSRTVPDSVDGQLRLAVLPRQKVARRQDHDQGI